MVLERSETYAWAAFGSAWHGSWLRTLAIMPGCHMNGHSLVPFPRTWATALANFRGYTAVSSVHHAVGSWDAALNGLMIMFPIAYFSMKKLIQRWVCCHHSHTFAHVHSSLWAFQFTYLTHIKLTELGMMTNFAKPGTVQHH